MKGHVIRQRWFIFLYVGKFDWKSFIKIKNERRGWFRQFRIDSDDELFHSKFPLSYKVVIFCSSENRFIQVCCTTTVNRKVNFNYSLILFNLHFLLGEHIIRRPSMSSVTHNLRTNMWAIFGESLFWCLLPNHTKTIWIYISKKILQH